MSNKIGAASHNDVSQAHEVKHLCRRSAQSPDEWNDFFDTAVSTHVSANGTAVNVQEGLYNAVVAQVDFDNLIDFVLVNQLAKHSEFFNGFNWYASKKDAANSPWQFHAWDVENWTGDLKVAESLMASQLDGNGKVTSAKRHPFYLHSLLMETVAYRNQVEERLLEALPVGGVGQPNLLSLAGVIQPVEAAFADLDAAIRGEIVRYPDATEANWLEGKNDLRNNLPYQHRGELILDYAAVLDSVLVSDYLPDNRLDWRDIDAFASAIRNGSAAVATHDLDGDQDVDVQDLIQLVNMYIGTFIGDSDMDGIFNSSDFVFVLSGGKYETGEEAGWQLGDWNGDGVFDSGDQVFAFQEGGYDSN